MLTNFAESLIDLFLFLALTETAGGEVRMLAAASSCIAMIGLGQNPVAYTFKNNLNLHTKGNTCP